MLFSSLKDPRQFSTVYPNSNILINQALHDLANNENNSLLVALIEDFLKQGQDGLISVAYNLAPNQEVADSIWAALQEAVNSPARNLQLFVIPLIIVVGSKEEVRLPEQIDQGRLQTLMLEKGVFTSATDAFISAKLYDLAEIAKLKPSEVYQLQQASGSIADFDFSGLAVLPIQSKGEQAHLRFLCAVSSSNPARPGLIKANYSKLGLELLQLLTTGLASPHATIFPLPFPPCDFSAAATIGRRCLTEIGITLKLSNLVKKLRLERKHPQIRLASQESQIKISVYERDSASVVTTLFWPIERIDNFELICQILADLFADMQLEVTYECHDI